MPTIALALVASLVVLVAAASAQTPVSGQIRTNATWTAAGSPYVLEGDVEVIGGATLTILAGVRVEFEPGSRLLIGGEDAADTGRLLVAGTSPDRVMFLPADPSQPSGGVELRPGAAWEADGTGSAFRFARFDTLRRPLTMREAVASLEDVVVFRAGEAERPAIVIELDPLADTALRAERVRVLDCASGGMSIAGGGNHELIGCRFVANAGRGLRMDMSVGRPSRRVAADVRVRDCVFLENYLETGFGVFYRGSGGGALLLGEAVWTVDGCTFEGNTSRWGGGGLYLANARDARVRSCAFIDNAAGGHGGGMGLSADGVLLIEDCRFSGNTASSDGGGIDASSPTELRRCVFEGNTASSGGAAYGRIMAVDCAFIDNLALIAGGAMQVPYNTRNFGVRGGLFQGNSASQSGGAVDFTDSHAGEEVRIEGAAFIDNRADFGGAIGGIGGRPTDEGARLTLVGNHFEANIARRGGALYVRPDALADLRLNLSAEGESINRFHANLATTGPAIANDSEHGVEARGVCWGVPTSAAVGTLIHDGLDDPALGIVAFDPIATGCLACPADLDGDGELTIFDFLLVQGLFAIGDMAADFDGDGRLTIFDFLAYQSAFDAGCP